jgi:hypothetical protein
VAIIHRDEPPEIQEKVNSFSTDMMEYNLTEYKIVQRHYNAFSNIIFDNLLLVFESEPFSGDVLNEHAETQVSGTMQTSDGDVYVMFYFAAGTQTLNLYTQQPSSGSYFFTPVPADVQHADNVLDWTKSFLEKYYTYSGNASYIFEARKALDAVNSTEPITITTGYIKLQISNLYFVSDIDFLSINLIYTSEGVDYESKAVRFQFVNGTLTRFTDTWNLE